MNWSSCARAWAPRCAPLAPVEASCEASWTELFDVLHATPAGRSPRRGSLLPPAPPEHHATRKSLCHKVHETQVGRKGGSACALWIASHPGQACRRSGHALVPSHRARPLGMPRGQPRGIPAIGVWHRAVHHVLRCRQGFVRRRWCRPAGGERLGTDGMDRSMDTRPSGEMARLPPMKGRHRWSTWTRCWTTLD